MENEKKLNMDSLVNDDLIFKSASEKENKKAIVISIERLN